MVVETHEVLRLGIRSLLGSRPGWKICGEASSGAEAIKKVETLRPDVLLLRVALPDIGVANAISRIIDVCPTVRIIALTAPDSTELAADALAAGAHGLALTSDEGSDLLLTLENLAQGKRVLSPAAVSMVWSQLARPKPAGAAVSDLTAREIEILGFLAKGQSSKELAAALEISVKTVNAHRAAIMQKLKLRSYAELVQFAIRQGIA
jgi:DNA-binding NarL/FixJ family response regulator